MATQGKGLGMVEDLGGGSGDAVNRHGVARPPLEQGRGGGFMREDPWPLIGLGQATGPVSGEEDAQGR